MDWSYQFFFTKFWGLFDSYWGWVFTDAQEKKLSVQKTTTFSFGVDLSIFLGCPKKNSRHFSDKNLREFCCFTGVFWASDFWNRTEELGQSEPKLQLSWWRCWWRCWMLDDWWGFFFLVLALDFFCDNLEKCQRLSGVFTKKNPRLRKLHKCPEQKSFSLQLKKKHPQHKLCFSFCRKTKNACKNQFFPSFLQQRKIQA